MSENEQQYSQTRTKAHPFPIGGVRNTFGIIYKCQNRSGKEVQWLLSFYY